MFKVNIYIETSIKSPTVKGGTCGALVEYTLKNGITVTKTAFDQEEKTTYNRLTLIAIIKALKLLGKPCDITIYTNNQFVAGQYGRNALKDWERSEWTTAKGKEVANKNLWQQFQEAAKDHNITMVYEKKTKYSKSLLIDIKIWRK